MLRKAFQYPNIRKTSETDRPSIRTPDAARDTVLNMMNSQSNVATALGGTGSHGTLMPGWVFRARTGCRHVSLGGCHRRRFARASSRRRLCSHPDTPADVTAAPALDFSVRNPATKV